MKKLLILATGLALAVPAVQAQSTASATGTAAAISAGQRKAAEELLAATDSEKNLSATIDRMLAAQLEQNPGMKAVEPEMRAYLTKYMSWPSMKEDMVQLYAREFTEKELKELTKFYQTPTGRKTITKMPALMAAGMEIGQKRMQEHLPELQQAIAEKLKSQAPAKTE
ncbi:DUF2059 domain-containing protein [Hymenobacter sp. 5516J-16]|uniref:DUF2059 domain-containing protein n=1 Tax=Hymenobacter sublimis TaxID=2933777 RepID=A0ABY4J6G7_9BACT|nr:MULTISPECIES: DUF2059 domain-containing protein [Hymenobacter]UOQ78019.1 DUF2059 domain-containing protein [Hymenobacter sp. 5516J-16]UPL48001.1 DUF2059 domain-containing protein [Hymenobacter sublimis]